MLAALVIVFREVLEAGLIVGIVLAATRGVPGRGRHVWLGIIGGAAGAVMVALFAGEIAALFEGAGQELFNASVLLAAVAMLAWHNGWMAAHGRDLAERAGDLGRAVRSGGRPLAALSVVVGVSVLREGAEVVLFLYGIAATEKGGAMAMMTGGLGGILAGAALSGLLYGGLATIPTRRLFAVTSALVTLLAAGMASQAVVFLEQGGFFAPLDAPLWSTRRFLPEDGLPGRLLHTLIGYSDAPTAYQLLAYGATIAGFLVLMNGTRRRRGPGAHPART